MRWLNAGDFGDATEHRHQTALISTRAGQDHWESSTPLTNSCTIRWLASLRQHTTEITWSIVLPAVKVHPDSQLNKGIVSMPQAIGPRW